MTVRVYTWEDEGAPELIMTNPTGYTSFGLERLKQILMACLVTGYGDKEPAGWTVSHEVEGGFSLSNGEGVAAFCHTGSTNFIELWLMDEVADGSSAIPKGPNARSGWRSDATPSGVPNHIDCVSVGLTLGWRHLPAWVLVADNKTVYLSLQGANTSPMSQLPQAWTHNYRRSMAFGRYLNALSLPDFMFYGGGFNATQTPPYMWQNNTLSQASSMQVLRNPATGGVDQGTDLQVHTLVPFSLSANQVQSQVPPSIVYLPTMLAAYGSGLGSGIPSHTPAGRLRGVFSCYPLQGTRWDSVYSTLSQQVLDDYTYAPMRPFTSVGGKPVVSLYNHFTNYASGVVISTAQEDWD